MGVAVSGWALARAVSQLGQLGVVSGTGLAMVLARRLQLGDPAGHMRPALQRFPVTGVAQSYPAEPFVVSQPSANQQGANANGGQSSAALPAYAPVGGEGFLPPSATCRS